MAVVIAVGGIIWAIVANLQPKFRSGITNLPAAIYVSGNGTASVLVDDYLYFVGDSVTTSAIQYGDNEYYANGKMPDTGIFRVRIADSKPVVEYKYDNAYVNDAGEKVEWQEGEDGYNQTVVGVNDWGKIGKKNNGIQAVVPKIAGHVNENLGQQTAMWVFGQYLIYTSPHNRYNKNGVLLSNYLDFFRVDLNGKNHTLLYTTDSPDLTIDNFTVWANATDNIYLLVHETDANEIRKVNVKTKKVTTLDTDVTNVVLPTATHYFRNSENESLAKIYGGVMSNVFYTKDRDTEVDNAKGNVLWRCPVSDGEPIEVVSQGSETSGTIFTPLAVTPLEPGDAQLVFSAQFNDYSNGSAVPFPTKIGVITNQFLDGYQEPVTNSWGLGDSVTVNIYANRFCVVGGALRRYEINGTKSSLTEQELLTGVTKVLAVFGNTAYVQCDDTVYIVNATTGTKNPISIVPASNSDSDGDSEGTSTTENTIALPVGVLYQPHGDTGDPMIFVQDANHIRLYTADGKFNYLKFKQS